MFVHPFTPFLDKRGFVLLDGGLSTELERQGHGAAIDHPLWTARLLRDAPDAISAAHAAFLAAGADCVLSASYQATIRGLVDDGCGADEAKELILRSYRLASEACVAGSAERQELAPVAAASLGPYGAYLADGSEYRGGYGVGVAELAAFHRERLDVLAPVASVLAFETIPSFDEARAIREVLGDESLPPAWVSFSCADQAKLADGSPLSEAAALFDDLPRVFGVGINCTRPELAASLVERLVERDVGKETIVYPNSGERYCADTKTWSGGVRSIVELAPRWRDLGARMVGGCCRVGATELAGLRDVLRFGYGAR